MTGEELGKLLVSQTKGYVDKAVFPIMAKLDALEKRFDAMPTVKDGRDGTDGKDADLVMIMAEVRKSVDEAVAEAVKAIPVPADGKDGEPGKDGADADPEAITEAVKANLADDLEAIRSEVKDMIGALPKAVDGKDGKDGEPGPKGEAGPKGETGEKGDPGKDGADVVGAIRDADGHLILTLSNGLAKDVGRVVGHDGAKGADGKDGKDGVGFDDMDVDFDGDRTVTIKWARGEKTVKREIVFPVPLDRGVYSQGKDYQAGDGVTYGGSFWLAQEDTTDVPGSSKAWRLAIKKGRDGKDGVMKPAPEAKTVKVK